ncbi:hypothetical protein [Shimazuella kribbensis]|uniref:hypothetical protein n=1 Tax=Shimazuella kribbensis TaxID=139808 RepID=UPI000400E109|nr:hypothetical protein [Shimazuella kribbensis]
MNNHPMWGILNKAVESKDMISIYTDISEQENFLVGFVEKVKGDYFLLQHVTAEGLEDGHVVRRMGDIYRIDQGSQYERKLVTLFQAQKQQHFDFLSPAIEGASPIARSSSTDEDGDLLAKVLKKAKMKQSMVTIKISDERRESIDSILGFVTMVTDEIVEIDKVSYYGEDDGIVVIFLQDIEAVNCDTTDELTTKLLYEQIHA